MHASRTCCLIVKKPEADFVFSLLYCYLTFATCAFLSVSLVYITRYDTIAPFIQQFVKILTNVKTAPACRDLEFWKKLFQQIEAKKIAHAKQERENASIWLHYSPT